jgi:predicted molibdopterin-dependent oxidoreductase YjgC
VLWLEFHPGLPRLRRSTSPHAAAPPTGKQHDQALIDGREIEVPLEYTLLQACEVADAELPIFCSSSGLSIAGNCRMCLVELVGLSKPVAS